MSKDSELITDDNQFGTPRSDALRRDFGVNALFYDPIHREVIDYVHGLDDLNHRVLKTIGDPKTRFREDPVRMLRAVKFAARLGFTIDESCRRAIISERAELSKSAIPRLYQEIINLLGSGSSAEGVRLLDELRLLEILMPEVSATMAQEEQDGRERIMELLHALDQQKRENQPVTHEMMLAALMWPMVEVIIDTLDDDRDTQVYRTIANELTRPFAIRFSVPRRTMESLLAIIEAQLRYERLGRKRSSRAALARTPFYGSIIHFAKLRDKAGDLHSEEQDVWALQAQEHPAPESLNRPRRRPAHGSKPSRRRHRHS